MLLEIAKFWKVSSYLPTDSANSGFIRFGSFFYFFYKPSLFIFDSIGLKYIYKL